MPLVPNFCLSLNKESEDREFGFTTEWPSYTPFKKGVLFGWKIKEERVMYFDFMNVLVVTILLSVF